jgi:hypothetical protein
MTQPLLNCQPLTRVSRVPRARPAPAGGDASSHEELDSRAPQSLSLSLSLSMLLLLLLFGIRAQPFDVLLTAGRDAGGTVERRRAEAEGAG